MRIFSRRNATKTHKQKSTNMTELTNNGNCCGNDKKPCCTLLAIALGELVSEGADAAIAINKEERGNFDLTNNAEKDDYNARLAIVQKLQLTLIQYAAGAFTCDGISNRCCEGYATGVKEALLGIGRQTIYNAYQTSLPLGEEAVLPLDATSVTDLTFPVDEQSVWNNFYTAVGITFPPLSQITDWPHPASAYPASQAGAARTLIGALQLITESCVPPP